LEVEALIRGLKPKSVVETLKKLGGGGEFL
jgi:hypothetical protein